MPSTQSRSDADRPAGGKAPRPIGAREHYIGVGILAFVMLFCTWVLIRGLAPKGVLWGHYDPSLFNVQVAAAPAAAAAPTPAPAPAPAAAPAGDPGEGGGGEGMAAKPGGGAKPAAKILPLAVGDWKASAVETFGPDNLYEKIDGRADTYLAFGMQRMEYAGYTKGKDSVDLYLYDLGQPLQAFGMFGSERTNPEPYSGVGQDSYTSSGSVFFWQQNYYALITAANGTPAEAAFAKELAKALAAKLPAGKIEIPALKWFPTQDLVPGTVTWIKDKALGQEWLNDVYTAKYKVSGQELQAFCARRDKPAEAAALAGKYRDYLKTAGKLSEETVDGVKLTIADQNGMFDIIYAKGSTFGGVTYTDQRAAATKLAARLAAAAP